MTLPKTRANRISHWQKIIRWTNSLKREFLKELDAGLVSADEAFAKLHMSAEEVAEWRRNLT